MWLLRMQMQSEVDHVHTTSWANTIETFAGYCYSTIQAKYSKDSVNFSVARGFNDEYSKLGGVNNMF
jgi:hypothetical protein